MKWIKFVVIAGGLCLSSTVPLISWGQATQSGAAVNGQAVVEGIIQDAQTKNPIAGAVVTAKTLGGTVRARQPTNAGGLFQFTLDPKQSYQLRIEAAGYDPHDEKQTFTSPTVTSLRKPPILLYRAGSQSTTAPVAQAPLATTAPVASAQAVSVPASATGDKSGLPPKTLDAKVIYTPPLIVAPVGKVTKLQALQFVQSKAELLPEAQPALEQLLDFMRQHPTTEILLAGHTDNQGNFDENLKLSQQRVDLVKDYLVNNGIEASRITAKGYGPTRPVANNKRESTRQLNRRVEMTVVKE